MGYGLRLKSLRRVCELGTKWNGTLPVLERDRLTSLVVCTLFLPPVSRPIQKLVYHDPKSSYRTHDTQIGMGHTQRSGDHCTGMSATTGKMRNVSTYTVPTESDRFSRLFLCGFLARPLAGVIFEALGAAPCGREINLIQGVPRMSFSHRLWRRMVSSLTAPILVR